ncbi:hypothetical protein F5B22DRAFT_607425 [Xylaria bambusicola]|uniref:uncharacterized protein n=1 Tax=Xylaria bambusicola TaxID=326684 RepID=UPI0020081DD2|nr:uncharacterized protein F5B22DRAFT_607425 [Xylaria bambusicola]KAI0515461.1 hypothetical protein F5B22DRAFT_607425 [Xylaria bambusicola]
MPRVRLPKLKLGFLKKLLRNRPEPAVGVEPVTNEPGSSTDDPATATDKPATEEPATDGPAEQHDEKAGVQEVLEECPICHDPVGATNPEGILESWTHLHCGHKFGTHCIQSWLQESADRNPHSIPSCPICRSIAKHPCGHPIVLTPRYLFFLGVPLQPLPPSNRRRRRRLSRRPGHPHRPPPSFPDQNKVQIVGKCSTCAAVAAAEESRKLAARGDETPNSRQGQDGDRRSGIKSMILQTSFRRPSISNPESPRSESRSVFIDPTTGRTSPTAYRDYLNLCRIEVAMARRPTPAPAIDRISTF